MSNFNRQEAFNRAVAGLWAQKAFSMAVIPRLKNNELHCAYRGENETKCAVGHLIPDDRYDPSFENQTPLATGGAIPAALDPELGTPDDDDLSFLQHMQSSLHDHLNNSQDGEWRDYAFKAAVETFGSRYPDIKVDVNLFTAS